MANLRSSYIVYILLGHGHDNGSTLSTQSVSIIKLMWIHGGMVSDLLLAPPLCPIAHTV